MGTLLTVQNWIQEEIVSRLNSKSACYYVLNNPFLFKLKDKIYKNITLTHILCRCETWSFRLREEGRIMVYERRVLGGIFGPSRD
jgi:hypothetical protein